MAKESDLKKKIGIVVTGKKSTSEHFFPYKLVLLSVSQLRTIFFSEMLIGVDGMNGVRNVLKKMEKKSFV